MLTKFIRASFSTIPKPRLFTREPTTELLVKLVIYQLCKYPAFLRKSKTLVNLSYSILGSKITNYMMEKTLGKVFLCGKNFDELNSEILRFKEMKVNSVADYGLEGVEKESPELIQKNKEEIIKTMDTKLDTAKDLLAVKVTSLTSLETLKKINEIQIIINQMVVKYYQGVNSTITAAQIREYFAEKGKTMTAEEAKQIVSYITKGKSNEIVPLIDIHYALHSFLLFGEQCPVIEKLCNYSSETKANLDMLRKHMIDLNEVSIKKGYRYFIDAEQQFIQHAIDSVCRQLQNKFNTEIPYILNTFQVYLKDTPKYVELSLDVCKKYNLKFGAKNVRGAYVTEENLLAVKSGYSSPVCPNKEETTKNFNTCLIKIINECPPKSHYIICTHNDQTMALGKQQLEHHKDRLKDSRISFGQLKGLADHYTYGLANEGKETFKYMPFGPTQELLAYLLRRIEEAGGYIGEQSRIQTSFVIEELFTYRHFHYKLLAGILLISIFPVLLLREKARRFKSN